MFDSEFLWVSADWGQVHGDHREGADIVGMADWVSDRGQKSTLYELNTLSVSFTHSLSSCLMTPCVVSSSPGLFVMWQHELGPPELS